ncbi:hypothetical protein JCM3765_002250 [Sporobolomyces pararoseus]
MRVMTEEEDSDSFSQSWLSDEEERSDASADEDEYGREVVSTGSGSRFEEDEVGPDNLGDMEEDGKRNLLRRLLALPPELLPEICSHLSPRDLLRWGRSCKLFRSIFFLKTTVSQTSWKLARRHVALPDLNWPMDEPEYASLVYDTHCMNLHSLAALGYESVSAIAVRTKLSSGCNATMKLSESLGIIESGASRLTVLTIDHILEFHSWCKLSDSIQFCSTSYSSDDDDDDDDTSEGSASTKSSEDEDDSED